MRRYLTHFSLVHTCLLALASCAVNPVPTPETTSTKFDNAADTQAGGGGGGVTDKDVASPSGADAAADSTLFADAYGVDDAVGADVGADVPADVTADVATDATASVADDATQTGDTL